MMFNSVFAAAIALAATAVAAPADLAARQNTGTVSFCRGANFVDCRDNSYTVGVCSTFGGEYYDNSATSIDPKGAKCTFYIDEYCRTGSGSFTTSSRLDLSKNRSYSYANDAISSVSCEGPGSASS
ncbi:hypothetical protein LZ554_009464 [Drepanopeziza brunnea f. sp. 'monogermtubi']|nr:hypothetical protein LZ554_009464 [Drepanopeziza brunnea f. sp. 'monogermtubi']